MVHKTHQKYTKRAMEMDAAKEKLEEEAAELKQAKMKEKTLENVVDQKKAELTDAKENVNATGTLDEEAELAVAEKHLEEDKKVEEELMDQIEEDAGMMNEARQKLPELNKQLTELRKEHGEKFQTEQEMREKY